MSTLSSSVKTTIRLPEIAASDLQAARDFLLDGARASATPSPERERPRRPANAASVGKTVVRNGISLARIRSSAKTQG